MKTVFPNIRILGIMCVTFSGAIFLILTTTGIPTMSISFPHANSPESHVNLARDIRVRAKLTQQNIEDDKIPIEHKDKLPEEEVVVDKSVPRQSELDEKMEEIKSKNSISSPSFYG